MQQSMVFYRSYTQWVGGLSFIYLIMMLFYPEQKLKAMKGMLGGGILRFRELLITICAIFTTYTVVLVLLVYAAGGTNPIYDVAIILSAVTGGGFVPSSTFIGPNSPAHLFLAGTGMVISALPFAFHYSVFAKTLRRKELITEVLIYASLIAAAFIVFLALSDATVQASAFHVVSASTNTGFQFIDVHALPAAAKVVLVVLMMIGGTAFSTAGGVKVGRLLLIYQRLTNRKMTENVASVSTPVVEKAFRESIIVIISFIVIAIGSGSVIASLEDAPVDDAIFEAVSALTTTGLSTGIIAVDSDIPSKLMLTANMVAGRFEVIAILYIFFSWLRR
jgi:trk system potassium uptake protein TrkH